MSFFSELLKGGAEGLFKGIGSFALDLRTAITGEAPLDPNKRAELLLQAQMLEASAEAAQLDFQAKILAAEVALSEAQNKVNMLEASSGSLFVSGWRPAVGWVCVSGLGYTFIFRPIFPWAVDTVAKLSGYTSLLSPLPKIPMDDLYVLLGGMLGLGAMRSYEKVKGSAVKTIK
jgi:hypothetical protein